MKSFMKLSVVAGFCIALSGCAALGGKKVVKAPCGPSAGMTDPCGNRTPINTGDKMASALDSANTVNALVAL